MDFWARRKAAVEAEAQAEDAQAAVALAAKQDVADAEKSDEELLAELGLPEPETLGTEADFKPFLADRVPQRIKTRALRCLWRSNPVLANVDGLVDYGEDFTDAACVIENLQTAYQVGKGMLAHVEEVARKAEEAEIRSGPAPESLSGPNEVDATETVPIETARATPDPDARLDGNGSALDGESIPMPSPVPVEPSDPGICQPTRRRMAFRFDDHTA